MATYKDKPEFLKTCIDSVLNQTFKNFEFIIVVESSEVNLDFLKNMEGMDSRVKIFKNESRLGVASSRNRAIRESLGRYIAIIDGDDYCNLSRFESQVKFLDTNPEVSVVGSNIYLIDEDNNIIGERRYPESHKEIKKNFLLTMALANPTIMMRRKDLEEIDLFDNTFCKAEDFELWLRFLAHDKRMHNLQENLVYYRIPSSHNERRGSIHWKNNYIARKRHGKFIWPIHQRVISMSFYFLMSHIPDDSLDGLLKLKIVNRIKNIEIH